MKKINGLVLSIVIVALLIGCGGGGGSSGGTTSTNTNSSTSSATTSATSTGSEATTVTTNATPLTSLEYLNSLRNKAGMISFKDNSLLNQSANNHARYESFNDLYGHYESYHILILQVLNHQIEHFMLDFKVVQVKI
jgi:uncharacterized protein YkwD